MKLQGITINHEGKNIPQVFGITKERNEELTVLVNGFNNSGKYKSNDMESVINYINDHPELTDNEAFLIIYGIGYLHDDTF